MKHHVHYPSREMLDVKVIFAIYILAQLIFLLLDSSYNAHLSCDKFIASVAAKYIFNQ